MTSERKLLIVVSLALATNLYLFLGVYREGSRVTHTADSLRVSENIWKATAIKSERRAKDEAAKALFWKHQYDSLEPLSNAAIQKADKFARKYEDLLKHPRVFVSDFQRDSILDALYPR